MKKYLSILLTFFVIGYFAPVACGDAGFLSGTGGEGEEIPTEEVLPPSEEAAPPTEPPTKEPESAENPVNPISTPNLAEVSKVLLPSIVVFIRDGKYVTAVSIPDMGPADYKLTAPNILQIGEESFIELILIPHTIIVNKDHVFKESGRGVFQFHLGDILIYPHLKAELIAGSSFSVSPSPSSIQIITMDKPTIWTWYITALKPGEHKISVNISVPVSNAGTTEDFPLEIIGFYVSILSPTPTPTNTSTPIPTSTPTPTSTPIPTPTLIPSLYEQLSGSAGNFVMQFSLTLIGSITSVLVALIGIIFFKNKNEKKKIKESREIIEKKKIETKNDFLNKDAQKEKRDAIHKKKK